MLPRDTDWRQGDLLTQETAVELGLVDVADTARRVIVITHDCDLPNETEAFVEVIIAEQVVKNPKPDPQLSYAKNPRRLHLICDEASFAKSLVLELRHTGRRSVPTADFAHRALKDSAVTLSTDAKRTLKQWLAARYGRPAFPNAFESRLRKLSGRRTIEQKISKILEPAAKHLVGLFFDLGKQRTVEVVDGEPYELSVSVVYDAVEGGSQTRHAAESVATQLHQLFEEAYGKPDVATEIALDNCEAVADTHMTLADLRRVDQWRLEYISLRDDENGDFLSVGEMPG
jgi:hypothetical protein